jgi:integrase
MDTNDILRMIKRRAKQAGLPYSTYCHTFRATCITTYLMFAVGTNETERRD